MTVTLDDIAIRLGRAVPTLGSPEALQWQMLLDDVMLQIRLRLGDPALLDQDALGFVVREAVAAFVRNPDEATQVDVSVDDARVSKMYKTGRGRPYILPEWWALLAPTSAGDGKAFQVNTTPVDAYGRGTWLQPDVWVPYL